jgi:hypothetical protein
MSKRNSIAIVVILITINLYITTQVDLSDAMVRNVVRFCQNLFQGLILFVLLSYFKFFTIKKRTLISSVLFGLLMLLSLVRLLINQQQIHSDYTQLLTDVYHFLRSPIIFVFLVPFMIILSKKKLS